MSEMNYLENVLTGLRGTGKVAAFAVAGAGVFAGTVEAMDGYLITVRSKPKAGGEDFTHYIALNALAAVTVETSDIAQDGRQSTTSTRRSDLG